MADINDIPGVMLRNRENTVLTTLRRIIPGNYKALREIREPNLVEAGFDFELARVYTDTLKAPLMTMLLGSTLYERSEPVSGIAKTRGEWTFVPDGHTGGAAGLWLFAALDYPDRFMKQIMPHAGGAGAVFMRPLKEGWLVGLQAIVLKSIIKNANRRDY